MHAECARFPGKTGTLGLALVFTVLGTMACDDGLTGVPTAQTTVHGDRGPLSAKGGIKGPNGGVKSVGRKGAASDTTNAAPPPDTTTASPPESPAVVSVVVTPNAASLPAGTTQQLAARLFDPSGNELYGPAVSWMSSNTVAATVSSVGLVTALAAGSATITATSEGVTGSSAVTVTAVSETIPGIPVHPGSSIQSAVNAAGTGATFVIKAGVHRRQTIVPKDGQKFIGEPGAILDGEGVTQFAFDTRSAPRTGVVLKGLVIRNYVPVDRGGQRGMIQAGNSTSWLVENNELYGSAVAGIDIGKQFVVRGNRIHNNARNGIVGTRAHGSLIEHNEVYLNGNAPKEAASIEGRSGMKIVRTENLTIKGNYVHHNYADGIWCDIDCRYVTIESNVVQNNSGRGIYYEISYDGVIKANLVEQNCLACGPGVGNSPNWYTGIAVSTSSRVQIYGNTVRDNANGIQVRMDNRGSGAHGTYQLTDVHVHGNIVRMKSGTTGLVQSVGDNSYFTSRNNRFERNSYQLGSLTGGHFLWMNGGRNWSNWRDYKQDTEGSATLAP